MSNLNISIIYFFLSWRLHRFWGKIQKTLPKFGLGANYSPELQNPTNYPIELSKPCILPLSRNIDRKIIVFNRNIDSF